MGTFLPPILNRVKISYQSNEACTLSEVDSLQIYNLYFFCLFPRDEERSRYTRWNFYYWYFYLKDKVTFSRGKTQSRKKVFVHLYYISSGALKNVPFIKSFEKPKRNVKNNTLLLIFTSVIYVIAGHFLVLTVRKICSVVISRQRPFYRSRLNVRDISKKFNYYIE